MGKRYLLDTNIIIYYLGGVLPEPTRQFTDKVLMHQANLSVISRIELLSWISLTQTALDQLNEFVDNDNVIGLEDEIIRNTILVGKHNKKVKLPDAIIAATCLTHNLTLTSRNKSDFKDITGLDLINPFDL
ncbi:type II toxin-antitoxin system VapC family toxin [Fulvivirgaceae bacterium PWU4]|uniref:Type II toxin-antitoxin system VapC family toxin n=1 Tax=Chryseosolibacter histidini TaxID=2782349 RepID=A0AAP2DKG3_9BACT|nr:type II toxin-antitoxin system VapC family toxin [Chryseosolibacter histidini]MBT1697766.1 type II toxin-antitoxin system VapC family toxin [Chryseosolibacter histidini]